MGTETENDPLDLLGNCETQDYLWCIGLVAKNKRECCSEKVRKTPKVSNSLNNRCNEKYTIEGIGCFALYATIASICTIRSRKVCSKDYKVLRGHLRILKTVSINSLVRNNEDWMEKRYNFNRLFQVVDPGRNSWQFGGPVLRPGSIVFYTDGSRLNNQVGAGVTGPGIEISVPMGRWPTVFQAEIQAILECSIICLRRNYKSSNICVMSDSQAALNALKSATCTSKLVWECVQSLQKLSCHNQVNLYWVPGH